MTLPGMTTEQVKTSFNLWRNLFQSQQANWQRSRNNPAYEDFEVASLAKTALGSADRAILFACNYVNTLENDNSQLSTANRELADELRLVKAERDRYRAERDGLWQVASHAETEHQRDQRMMYARED